MRGGETVQIPDLALETSIYEVKDQYAKQTSLPHEKIKVLLNKKPAADLKTLKELGVTGDVEFSVMVLGGGGATPSAGTPAASSPAVEKTDPVASVPEVPAAPPAEDKMDIVQLLAVRRRKRRVRPQRSLRLELDLADLVR
jgi:hypothetical protein